MGEDLGLPPVTTENVLLGLAVLAGGVLLSYVVRIVVRTTLRWRRASPSSRHVFGLVAQWVVVLLAFVAAVTVTFPSVRPVNALGGIGIISIAAGIAFQTVLGNMFAGFVILARDSFRVGDQIEIEETAGTVTHIHLSHTGVRTFDGRKVLVPNAKLHSELVSVQTGYEEVRSTVDVEIDDQADLHLAQQVAERAMREVSTVVDEPAPQALLSAIGSATVTMELRFWSGARQMETRQAQNDVIVAVLTTLREAGVATGSDVLVLDAAPRLRDALQGARTEGSG